MRFLRLFFVFFRIGAMGELAYRANFFLQLLESAVDLGTALGGLAVVFSYTSTLGGWRPEEVAALIGVFFLVGGALRLVVQPSMEQLIENVREGTLDFMLTKPEDSQVLASIQRVEIWKITDFFLGIAVIIVALIRMGERLGALQVVEFAAALVAGGVIVYSFWIILASLSFWFVRVENILVVFQSVYEAGRWPVTLYPGWLRIGLTFLVPIAFATTVPAQALAGQMTWQTLAEAFALAAALFAASRFLWRAGTRHYSGASA